MMDYVITRRDQPSSGSLHNIAPPLSLFPLFSCLLCICDFHPCILTIVQACCLPVSISACKSSTPNLLSHAAHLCIRVVPHVFSRPVVSLMMSSILNPVLSFFRIYRTRKSLSRSRECFHHLNPLLSRTASRARAGTHVSNPNHEGRRRL